MSKGNFMFAAPAHIPQLMDDFQRKLLEKYTPCIFDSRQDVIAALAIVHTELILIHPFREGNGRLARLLATLMALQAGYLHLTSVGLNKNARKSILLLCDTDWIVTIKRWKKFLRM